MKFQKELDTYGAFLTSAKEQMAILKDRSDEQGAIDLYNMWIEKRKELLRLIAEEFRKTGNRLVETDDVLLMGELDHSWFVLPEPKAVRVVS